MDWILQKARGSWAWFLGLSCFGQKLPLILAFILFFSLLSYIFCEISTTECEAVGVNHEGHSTAIECERDSLPLKKVIETMGSDTVRNLSLLLAASIGWFFFYWRAKTADLNAEATEQSAKATRKNAETAEKGLTVDRFSRSIEHLAHEKTSIRLGGIRSLEQIAKSHEEEREKIIQILSTRIREIAPLDATKETKEWLQRFEDTNERERLMTEERYKRLDVETIAKVLSDITRIRSPYHPCELYNIDLSGLLFIGDNLANCIFSSTNMSHASFLRADFSNAKLEGVNISRASFVELRGLTQEQINQTFYYKGYEPLFLPHGLQLPEERNFPHQNR